MTTHSHPDHFRKEKRSHPRMIEYCSFLVLLLKEASNEVKIENECLTASFIKIKQVRSRRAARPYVLAATHPRCSARPRALCTQSPPPRPPLAPSLTTFSSHPPLHTFTRPNAQMPDQYSLKMRKAVYAYMITEGHTAQETAVRLRCVRSG
jgi:hypothetical protein